MPGTNAADGTKQAIAIVNDLRAYADAGVDPTFAVKLRAAAEEIERRLCANAGDAASA